MLLRVIWTRYSGIVPKVGLLFPNNSTRVPKKSVKGKLVFSVTERCFQQLSQEFHSGYRHLVVGGKREAGTGTRTGTETRGRRRGRESLIGKSRIAIGILYVFPYA